MKHIIACLGLVALTGCATQTAFIQSGAKVEPTFSKSQSFYISGIGQEKTVNAAEVCGGADKVAKVQSLQKAKRHWFNSANFGYLHATHC